MSEMKLQRAQRYTLRLMEGDHKYIAVITFVK